MKYIISLFKGFAGQGYYVRDNKNGTWDEIYDPRQATPFASKMAANDWVKTKTTFAENATIEVAATEIENFEKWLATGGLRRSFTIVDLGFSRKYKNETPEEVLEWRWECKTKRDEQEVRYEDYRTWPELYTVFKHLWSVSGFYADSKREKINWTFEIRVEKTSKFDEFKKELDLVIDRVMPNADGEKQFPVFDHYLSEGGNKVSLILTQDGKWELEGRYGSNREFKDLEDAFAYLCRERYYGDD